MPTFSAYDSLPALDQILHSLHVMLCCFALLAASVPALTEKGSPEHKFGGLLYVMISGMALAFGCAMAWRESNLVLFSFDCFCAYLLFSGWRAAHSNHEPRKIDWAIPLGMLTVSAIATASAVAKDMGLQSFYLLFFALNASYLALRDLRQLKARSRFMKYRLFMPDLATQDTDSTAWLGRHIAGMVGSAIANLSVVVLTFLPLSLHWLWPASLILIGSYIAWKERQKKLRVRRAMATIITPKFGKRRPGPAHEDWRKAA